MLNRTTLVVSVDRSTLLELPEDGIAVVERLAKLLEMTPKSLDRRLTLCGTEGAPEPPVCWNGSPYQPIPVAEDAAPEIALPEKVPVASTRPAADELET